MSENDFLKPKNQTLQERKKKEQVFIPELHSHPELMSYSEKLELAEEIASEIFAPYLEREGLSGEVLDVRDATLVYRLRGGSVEDGAELASMVKEETSGIFTLEVVFD